MIHDINEIKKDTNPLLYERAFVHFLQLKNLFYFPTTAPRLNNGVPVPIYRSKVNDPQESFFTDFKDLSYREGSKVSSFGRINRPLQACFYASGEINTCLSELEKDTNMRFENSELVSVTTGKWVMQEDLRLCVIPDWENQDLKKFMDKIEELPTLSEENLNVLKLINNLFKTKDENSNIHKITSAFCNAITFDAINQNIPFDGFLYSSVQNGIGFNVGLSHLLLIKIKLFLIP